MNNFNWKTVLVWAGSIASLIALYLVYVAHQAANAAAAQQSDPTAGAASSLPNVLFTTGGGATSPALMTGSGNSGVATGGSTIADGTTSGSTVADTSLAAISAALQSGIAAVASSTTQALNKNATDLFKDLPASLSAAGLTDFSATQAQDATGKTSLDVAATYRSSATPPAPPSPKFIVGGQDYGSAQAFINAQTSNYTRITGQAPSPEAYATITQQVVSAQTA